MTTLATRRPTLCLLAAVAAAVMGAACSDQASLTPAQQFAQAVANQQPVVRALGIKPTRLDSAAPAVISDDQFYAWAQLTFPDWFPSGSLSFGGVAYLGKVFAGRAYASGNYLAIADGELYGLGPLTGGQLVSLGAMQNFASTVCESVDCARAAAPTACALSPGESLRTGTITATRYRVTPLQPAGSPYEIGIDSLVDGPASFLGQDVVRVVTTLRDAAGSAVAGGTSHVFQKADASGATWLLGTEAVDGSGMASRRVTFSPPLSNSEFALAAGQAVTKVQTATTTSPPGGAASSEARATTFTFEARESLDVQGRRYDTCRYRETSLAGGPVTVNWVIVGSGLPARSEVRSVDGTVLQRHDLLSGTVNGVALAPGPATLDAASVDRMVAEFGYVMPICSAGGAAKAAGLTLATKVQRLLATRHTQRAAALAAAPDRRALAYTSTRPEDRLGDCGGRITYPSYQHVNGVTTATMRMDSYCSKDSDTGGTQVTDGSWSFVETAQPGATGPIRVRYEASSPAGLAVVDRDASGKVLGTQRMVVVGYVSTVGVPGGDPTPERPDRIQVGEWQVHNVLTGKVYRQTGYSVSTFLTAAGGEQTTISGRGYRSTGFYDLTTTSPIVSNADGDVLSGVLTSTGADGQALVMTLVPGADFQATMTVDGKPVTTAPACQ
jgi:hypothetical protein